MLFQSHYQSRRHHHICLAGCFCMTVPNRTQFSINLGTNRKQTAFSPWCMFFLLLCTPCGDSMKQVSISNRQHSLKSFQLVQLSETMNLLLTSVFLFGMGWESGDKKLWIYTNWHSKLRFYVNTYWILLQIEMRVTDLDILYCSMSV